ncbi:MAG: LacI family transcriptional regulator [Oscillochloris sp.]|nr:LacI family transcriptional regulator [Oscillochloris sp.]
MPTIDEIAKLANVSPATVSKVINNRSYVRATTRARVEQVIAETGYVPSQRARWLSTRRSHILGLLIPYRSDQIFADPHLLEIMRGIESVADEHGYSLLLSTVRTGGEAANPMARLLSSDVTDGAVVVETLDVRPETAPAGVEKPWAVIGYANDCAAPAIHADDYGGACMVTGHLLELGHRRIGVISSAPRPSALDERLRGVRDTLRANGLDLADPLLGVGDFSPESGERAALQLLALPEPPSAIFALNDRMAFGALRAAQQLGLSIPAELSVVGFDDISLATLLTPALTTVRQPGYQLGVAAAEAVFAILDGAPLASPVVIPTRLVVRATTAPPRKEVMDESGTVA